MNKSPEQSLVESAPLACEEKAAVLPDGEPIVLVQDGKAGFGIVTAPDAEPQIAKAARTLAEYVEKATGTAPACFHRGMEGFPPGLLPFCVGTTPDAGDAAELGRRAAALKADGFIIRMDKTGIVILGSNAWGTEFGVYEFLERYVGVRWLMPGEDGEDVPSLGGLTVPQEDIVEQPAMLSRALHPLQPYEVAEKRNLLPQYVWGVRNRQHMQISGTQHVVFKMFPSSKYRETNPEFYPLRNGARYFPADDEPAKWQPCFSEPGTVPVAAAWVKDYFRQNPAEISVSLSVNDQGRFCEEEPEHPLSSSLRKNSFGKNDLSELYFAWVNRVVEMVTAEDEFKDKWFGVLAYREVADPPSFKLHPRVVVFMTRDRMAWMDDDVRQSQHALVAAWKDKASCLGFYEYAYGSPYVLPRVYNQVMGANFRYGFEQNVIAYFAELLPNWGEGPKPWIMARLQWNPLQNVDALLRDWYERAVGPEAAGALKAFYDHWEHFWTVRVRATNWFQHRKTVVYFNFNSAAYLSIVTDEEIAACRSLLEAVVAKAVTARQKARARLLLRAFEYYEASALSYPKEQEPPASEDAALALLERATDRLADKLHYARKRMELVAEFQSHEVLRHLWPPVARGTSLAWSGVDGDAFWMLADYEQRQARDGKDRLLRRVTAWAERQEAGPARQFVRLLLNVFRSAWVNVNPSFEQKGEGASAADGWEVETDREGHYAGHLVRSEEQSCSGTASIEAKHLVSGCLYQTLPIKAGMAAARLSLYEAPGGPVSLIGGGWLQLDLLDEAGNKLRTAKSERFSTADRQGEWRTVRIVEPIPESIDGSAVKQATLSVRIEGYHSGGTLYLDDFQLFHTS